MRFVSLFAGIGGLDLGLERSGMRCVGQVEIDPYCRAVLAKHWPHVPRLNDVREFQGHEFGEFDLLCGGVPCQPASCAGKRKGADDERWLWGEWIRIVRAARPAWFVAENVRGFLSLSAAGGVVRDLEGAGYEVRTVLLGAHHVGAPHKRDRIWIVGKLVNAVSVGLTRGDAPVQEGRRNGIRAAFTGPGPRMAHTPRGGPCSNGCSSWSSGHADECGACEFCGYRFDIESLGKYGCPNCEGEGVADAQGPRREGPESERHPRTGRRADEHGGVRWPSRPGEPQHGWEAPRLVHTNGRGSDQQAVPVQQRGPIQACFDDAGPSTSRIIGTTQPRLGDAVDGLPRRLAGFARRNALKALGNSIVPSVAEVVGRAIMESLARKEIQ